MRAEKKQVEFHLTMYIRNNRFQKTVEEKRDEVG